MFAYCKNNDILIEARSMRDAVEYAKERLHPDNGVTPDWLEGLNLRRVSAEKADELRNSAIVWEI